MVCGCVVVLSCVAVSHRCWSLGPLHPTRRTIVRLHPVTHVPILSQRLLLVTLFILFNCCPGIRQHGSNPAFLLRLLLKLRAVADCTVGRLHLSQFGVEFDADDAMLQWVRSLRIQPGLLLGRRLQ